MHVNLDSLIFWRKKNRIDDYVWNLQRDTNTKWSLTKTEGPLCQDNESLINSHVRMKIENNRIGPLPSELYTCKSSQLIFFQGIDLRKSYRILEELHDSNTSDQEIGHFCVYMWVLWEIVKWKLSDSCRFVAPW